MKAEEILKQLVEIRLTRRAKFVAYEDERRLRKREHTLWNMAEALFNAPKPPPPARNSREKSAA